MGPCARSFTGISAAILNARARRHGRGSPGPPEASSAHARRPFCAAAAGYCGRARSSRDAWGPAVARRRAGRQVRFAARPGRRDRGGAYPAPQPAPWSAGGAGPGRGPDTRAVFSSRGQPPANRPLSLQPGPVQPGQPLPRAPSPPRALPALPAPPARSRRARYWGARGGEGGESLIPRGRVGGRLAPPLTPPP